MIRGVPMSLGRRLALWMVCPLLLTLLLVTAFILYQGTEWRKTALRERIITTVELQAPELARALTHDTRARLDGMARRLLEIDEARGIGIYTGQGRVHLELGRSHPQVATSSPQATRLDVQEDRWHLLMPLSLDTQGSINADPAWLELDIDSSAITLDAYRRLATTGLGLMILSLILLMFAWTQGRRIDSRLNRITRALEQLRNGKLEARLPEERDNAELRRLAQQVNLLDTQIQHWRESQQQQLEQS